MRWKQALLAVPALVALVAVGDARHDGAGADQPGAPITIDAAVGETFTPVPAASVRLSGDQAIAAADRQSLSIPSDAVVRTGRFTFPVGPGMPGKYVDDAHDTMVYAFSWQQCGPWIEPAPRANGPTPSPPPLRCTAWVIVDATTGKVDDTTWS